MSTTATTKAKLFSKGRKDAAYWLKDQAAGDALSLLKFRAIHFADVVLQHEQAPQFDELITSWESGFDSTVRAHQDASNMSSQAELASTAQFAALTMDVTEGLQLCIETLEDSLLATRSDADISRLARLAAAAAQMLAEKAGQHIGRGNNLSAKEGK